MQIIGFLASISKPSSKNIVQFESSRVIFYYLINLFYLIQQVLLLTNIRGKEMNE